MLAHFGQDALIQLAPETLPRATAVSLDAATDPAKSQPAIAHFVQPGYFATGGRPMVAGRAFSDDDNRPEARVIVIDDLLAARLFPTGQAVGRRLLARVTTDEPQTFDVIGVSQHQRHPSARRLRRRASR